MRLWALERAVAASLEEGRGGWLASALARGWSAAAARSRRWAGEGVRVIGVEGSTLGGSWRTPVSLALAEALGAEGRRVGVLAHGYGGRGTGGEVTAQTGVEQAGDEAVLAARRLAGSGVVVAVGPQGLSWLASRVEVVVADGLRVARGEARASLLSVDGERPWGAGQCPPAGDLRASPEELLRASSQVVRVGGEPGGAWGRGGEGRMPWGAEPWLEASALAGRAVVVVTAVARPGRFVGALRARGVRVSGQVELPDHGGKGAAAEVARRVRGVAGEVIVCTEKCALWLPERIDGRPVVAVRGGVTLPAGLVRALWHEVAARGCFRGAVGC